MDTNPGTLDATADLATEEKQDDIITELQQGADFFFNVALGNVPGHANPGMIGDNSAVGLTEETIWNVGGQYVYLTADTPLFISSSSASDTGTYAATGLNDLYARITSLATATGQTQAAFSTDMFRVQVGVLLSASGPNVGDIYIAESTPLTDGVPDDLTKVKVKIPAGEGVASNGTFTTSADTRNYMIQIQDTVGKGKNADFVVKFRQFGQDFFVKTTKAAIYQSPHNFGENIGFFVGPKVDIEFAAVSTDVDANVNMISRVIRVDD